LSRQNEHPRERDEDLVAAIRLSDEGAFSVLYERYYRRVYNFIFLRLRDHADTEEAVQEAFTAIFRSVSSFRGRSSVSSWIYGIAKNTANHHIRQTAAHARRIDRMLQESPLHVLGSAAGTPEEDLALRRCAESVRDEFAELSDWQSEIFEMRHLDNLPISEICARTERSPDAVRSSLFRVKRLIVAAIENGRTTSTDANAEGSLA